MLGQGVFSEGKHSMVMMLPKPKSHQLELANACLSGAAVDTVVLEGGGRRR